MLSRTCTSLSHWRVIHKYDISNIFLHVKNDNTEFINNPQKIPMSSSCWMCWSIPATVRKPPDPKITPLTCWLIDRLKANNTIEHLGKAFSGSKGKLYCALPNRPKWALHFINFLKQIPERFARIIPTCPLLLQNSELIASKYKQMVEH